MTATEFDILHEEQERNYLLTSIAAIEAQIAVASPGTKRILENTVENARKRVTTLDKKIEEAKIERAVEVQAQAASAAVLAAKETKLNASERETYRGFLQESYFTKRDVGRLDEFYRHGYDRLSEGGKDEMSKRLHEGIKRGELQLSDLSQAIRERDNAHCSAKGKKETAAQPHVSTSDDKQSRPSEVTTKTVNEIDLGSVDLSGIKLADASGSPAASNLPDISNSQAKYR